MCASYRGTIAPSWQATPQDLMRSSPARQAAARLVSATNERSLLPQLTWVAGKRAASQAVR